MESYKFNLNQTKKTSQKKNCYCCCDRVPYTSSLSCASFLFYVSSLSYAFSLSYACALYVCGHYDHDRVSRDDAENHGDHVELHELHYDGFDWLLEELCSRADLAGGGLGGNRNLDLGRTSFMCFCVANNKFIKYRKEM